MSGSPLARFAVVAFWLVWSAGAATARAAESAASEPGAQPLHLWSDGYTLVGLEDGADLQAARALVQAAGGTVALLLPPRHLTGWIPPELDPQLLGRAGIRALERRASDAPVTDRDPSAGAALRFFARAARGELDPLEPAAKAEIPAADEATPSPEMLLPDAWPRGDISPLEIAANLDHVGIAAHKGSGAAGLASNSDFMTGTVSVTLFFVESDGSGLDPNLFSWNAADEQDVFDDAAAALSWWVSQARKRSDCWVVFRLDANFATQDPRCAQWREPTLHPSTDYGLVVQQVLGNFGYGVGGHLARAAAYDAALRVQNQTDWAYCAFVAANPSGARQFTDGWAAWAYMGGPYVAALQRSFSWSFKQVFAHETAHMFRACDEYYTPGYGGCTDCGSCADTGVPNGNCDQCNPGAVSCMMRSNAYALCDYTAGQLGWWRTPCTDQDLPAPRLDGVEPELLAHGAEADVELQGDFFAAGATASFGPDVEVLSQEVLAETRLGARVRVGLEAALGPRDVVVTGPDGQTDRLAGGFLVGATRRHFASRQGGNASPFDRPERAAIDLATALAACSSGDTLFLAGGTYGSAALHRSVTILGGWADDFEMRAPEGHPSIVQGAGIEPAMAIDGATSAPVLDGLVLCGGAAQLVSTPELGNLHAGGGLLVIDAAPTLRRCVIEGNRAGSPTALGAGGGGFFWRARPTLVDCTVRDNQAARGAGLFFLDCTATLAGGGVEANEAGGSGLGAGIAALDSRLDVGGTRLAGNRGAEEGGGLHLETCPQVRLASVTVDSNEAARSGGGIASRASCIALTACRVTRNTAGEQGGGLCANADTLRLESTVVAGNHAAILGGGLFLAACTATLENVTVAEHGGCPASGIYWAEATSAGTMRGCILAENALGGLVLGGGVPPALDYNLYWQNGDLDHPGAPAGAEDLVADPRFANASALDLQLALGSPGIDSGDPDPSFADPDGSCNDRGAHGGPRAAPAAPARVEGLAAVDLGASVRLGWDPSRAHDVSAYVVYRDSSASFRPVESNRVATLSAPTTNWLDTAPAAGGWYRVVVVDAGGHASGFAVAARPSPPSDAALPARALALCRIAPNPANPGAWIEYELPGRGDVRLEVFDARGRRVRGLAIGADPAGRQRAYWDGRDDAARAVGSGVYLVRLTCGPAARVAKLTVVR